MEKFVIGNIRVQILNNDIIRLEYGKQGKFFDGNSFFIPNRVIAKNTDAHIEDKNVVCLGSYRLFVPENTLSGVRLEKHGKCVYVYKKLVNSGELPPFGDTPEVFAVSDTPRIIIPEGGYSADRKGEYVIEEDVEDIYLLLCAQNARKLRKQYVELTGRNEMVRLSTLGTWNSKYYPYTEDTARELISDYEKHNVPLDVMVIDTDWRSCENGWGYDINTKLFPDMKRFIDFAHAHGVEIMFNDHPEPQDGKNVFEDGEIAYRERNLQALLDLGLDIWWYDRNWTSSLISPTNNVRHETFGLYLFEDIMRNYRKKQSKNQEIYRRPVIMGNVVDIKDGEYRGITDSASHRYSIQWTGDIKTDLSVLGNEIESLLKATDNCIPYINSDCGGHIGNPDKEEYIRWMQYGALSPILRPHCCNDVKRYREPWVYDKDTLDIVREFIELRYRLLPVIYKNAYNNYLTGEPIFKSLGWEYPKDKTALQAKTEYMLGNNLLISPITHTESRTYLPEGKWLNVFDGTVYAGKQFVSVKCKLNEMPLFVRCGAIIPLGYNAHNTKAQLWNRLVFDYYPDKKAQDFGFIYEDDTETTAYKYGQHRITNYSAKFCKESNAYVVNIEKATGVFEGDRCFDTREITVKRHLFNEERAIRATVNGEEVEIVRKAKDADTFPLNTGSASADGECESVTFKLSVNDNCEIKFYI